MGKVIRNGEFFSYQNDSHIVTCNHILQKRLTKNKIASNKQQQWKDTIHIWK